MISVRNLTKHFGRREAVKNVSFEVGTGEVLGFLGPNGAGKTTTMRMVTGFYPPTSGTAVVNGYDIAENPVDVRASIGYLPENAPLYGEMSVEAFLRFIAEMRGFSGRERTRRVDAAMETCFLAPVRRQSIDTLSRGYRQRTCFAQAILHDPPELILDEPTEGLDPNQKQVVRNMIRNMGREKAIVFSTHILEEVEAVCTRAIIISAGVIVADASPTELKKRSSRHNAVLVHVEAPAGEARAAFAALDGVAHVELAGNEAGCAILRLFPGDGAVVVPDALDLARTKGWKVLNIRTEEGRLEEAFRQLTTTADVSADAVKEVG